MDDESWQGYVDGGDPSAPEPGENRSHLYRHSFEVARRERAGKHWPAHVAREKAEAARVLDGVVRADADLSDGGY